MDSNDLDSDLQPLMERHPTFRTRVRGTYFGTRSTSSSTTAEEYAAIRATLAPVLRQWNRILRTWAQDKGWLPKPTGRWRFMATEHGEAFARLVAPDGALAIEPRYDPNYGVCWLAVNDELIDSLLARLNGDMQDSSSCSYSTEESSREIPDPGVSRAVPQQEPV